LTASFYYIQIHNQKRRYTWAWSQKHVT